ncbi:hypothetical protein IE81DRAFT_313388 [Ceraceosorus guamensis]|uniref:Uncharacterized protein n=1 Tax=Ceraceosorus guamensis TaxID=1522189 RepID=A0A316VY41_9BASI|nr:hypothetical protein IE81DRAFT_313388 [Ceraceosorus guamensis]PWN42546.1 hypothetical protein IE81DRAFT_313388 [Ceraceosorus guamensis]
MSSDAASHPDAGLLLEREPIRKADTQHLRLGHALASHQLNHRRHHHELANMKLAKRVLESRDAANCAAGGLYLAPAADATVPSANKTTISWDNSCLDKSIDKIDVYVYAPGSQSASLPIHAYVGIPANRGSYDIKLAPKWWNATSNVDLQLNIVKSGNEPWDSSNPSGPIWHATYAAPLDGSAPPDDAVLGGSDSKIDSVVSVFYSGGSLTASGKTAAIVCPIIVVLCALGVWIRKLHINRNNKTADWADHMDKRMSRISLDWNSGGDGAHGPTPGSRPASFMRPQSTFARPSMGGDSFSNNMAGRGAGAYDGMVDDEPEMSEAYGGFRRPPTEGRDSMNRQSRISFAADTAGDRVSRVSYGPSSEGHSAVRGHKQSSSMSRVRSYYDPDAPAMPKLDNRWQEGNRESRFNADEPTEEVDDSHDLTYMSPTQNQGPTPIGNGDVDTMRASLDAQRALGGNSRNQRALTPADDEADNDFRNSVLKYPALSMVTGREGSDGHDMFGRPVSGLSEGGESAYAPAEQGRQDEYIDHSHYGTAGAHAISPDHPARRGAPSTSAQTGMAPARNLTSPDDALRQYAALRAAPGAAPSNGSSIYIDAPGAPGLGHRVQGSVNTAGSSLNEDDVVGYNQMEHFNSGR